MAFANLMVLEAASSSSYRCFRDTISILSDDLRRIAPLETPPRRCCFVSSCLTRRRRWSLNAATLRAVDHTVNGQSSHLAGVEIPVTCYQVRFFTLHWWTAFRCYHFFFCVLEIILLSAITQAGNYWTTPYCLLLVCSLLVCLIKPRRMRL